MATKTPTVTDILMAYRDGTLSREKMLDAMRTYPWKAVETSDPRLDTAWENETWPQPGTVQEVYAAEASRIISAGDSAAICDVIRNRNSG